MLSCLPLRIITNLFTNKNTRDEDEDDKINLRRRGRQPKDLSKVKWNEKKISFLFEPRHVDSATNRILTPISTYLSNLFTLAVADCRFHKFDQWDAHGVVFNATVTRSGGRSLCGQWRCGIWWVTRGLRCTFCVHLATEHVQVAHWTRAQHHSAGTCGATTLQTIWRGTLDKFTSP